MARIDWGCETLNYTDEGTGTPILFLHGLGGNVNNWLNQRRALSDHHRVISLDLPGHGRSTGSRVPFSRYPEAVHRVLDRIEASNVSVVGLAMGARVGITLAHRAPRQISRLTLVNAYLTLPPDEHEKRVALYDLLLRRGGARQWAETLLDGMGVAGVPRIAKGFVGSSGRIRPSHINRVFHEVDETDQRQELRDIDVPTQVMIGMRDRLVPAAATEDLLSLVRHPVIHRFPESGHLPYLEESASFNSALDAFIHS